MQFYNKAESGDRHPRDDVETTASVNNDFTWVSVTLDVIVKDTRAQFYSKAESGDRHPRDDVETTTSVNNDFT